MIAELLEPVKPETIGMNSDASSASSQNSNGVNADGNGQTTASNGPSNASGNGNHAANGSLPFMMHASPFAVHHTAEQSSSEHSSSNASTAGDAAGSFIWHAAPRAGHGSNAESTAPRQPPHTGHGAMGAAQHSAAAEVAGSANSHSVPNWTAIKPPQVLLAEHAVLRFLSGHPQAISLIAPLMEVF